MSFRGTVVNGVVVPDAGQALPEGMRVLVNPLTPKGKSRRAGGAAGPRARPKRGKVHPLLALSGIWADRPDFKGKSSVQIVAELRRSSGPRRG